MITLLISLLPLVIYSYFFIFLRKKEDVRFYIDYGLLCYNCQEETCTFEDKIKNNNLKKDINLCVSCTRDEKLDKLANRINKTPIKRFLLSNKINTYVNIILILALSSILLGLILDSVFIRSLGNLFNTLYALIFISRINIYKKKKPSH